MMQALLLACIFLLWSGESVLLKQLEPTNGTPARPGDRIKFLCNTTFSDETALVWGIIDGESTRGFFGNHMNASNGTLKLPNGDTATWEAKALHGATQTLTSSLTINASSGLHNVTIACCSDMFLTSLCSESAATANEFRGMAVIKINSEWDNMDDHYSTGHVTTQPKDHTSQYNVVWGAMSSVSLLVCMVALVFQITELCSTSDKNLWVLVILINATLFAAINTCQIPIYQFKQAGTKYCTVLGFMFQVNLISNIITTAVLSLCLYNKLKHLELQSKIVEFYNTIQQFKSIILHPQYISIAVVAVGITVGITITPFVHSSYGDAGGWCWIKPSSNNAGATCQIMTSSLGLIIALMGFVFAMTKCCKRKEDLTPYNDKYFLTTAMCFLASFLIGNLNSLISRITLATGTTPFRAFTFFHSIVNPLWPLITALPSIVQLFIKIWKRGRQQPE